MRSGSGRSRKSVTRFASRYRGHSRLDDSRSWLRITTPEGRRIDIEVLHADRKEARLAVHADRDVQIEETPSPRVGTVERAMAG